MTDRPPPPGWTLEFSKRMGRHYYFNKATNESKWEYPGESATTSATPAAAPKVGTGPAASTAAPAAARQPSASQQQQHRSAVPSGTPVASALVPSPASGRGVAAEPSSRIATAAPPAAEAIDPATAMQQFLDNIRLNIQLLKENDEQMFYRLQPEPDSHFRDLAYVEKRIGRTVV